jgi:hypothetical protein
MTRERKLKEVLNVRLDAALAREIRRIARAKEISESEVARGLLAYGAEVERRLEAQRLMLHFRSDQEQDVRLGQVVVEARWEPFDSIEELDRGAIPEPW